MIIKFPSWPLASWCNPKSKSSETSIINKHPWSWVRINKVCPSSALIGGQSDKIIKILSLQQTDFLYFWVHYVKKSWGLGAGDTLRSWFDSWFNNFQWLLVVLIHSSFDTSRFNTSLFSQVVNSVMYLALRIVAQNVFLVHKQSILEDSIVFLYFIHIPFMRPFNCVLICVCICLAKFMKTAPADNSRSHSLTWLK